MIRKANLNDLNRILEIFQTARDFMSENGNETQWGRIHPQRTLLENDIEKRQLYLYLHNEIICGVFALIFGDDPTYAYIENGSWLNNDDYGTIHRIASNGKVKGVFSECLKFCQKQITNLRIDTHEKNLIMQYILEKYGFQKCGFIYLPDGDPRIAYHFINEE